MTSQSVDDSHVNGERLRVGVVLEECLQLRLGVSVGGRVHAARSSTAGADHQGQQGPGHALDAFMSERAA